MQKKIRKIVSSILASCMVISAFAGIAPQKAEAKTTLVNVAVNGTVSTQNGENGSYVIGNINDGDPKTSWQTQGTWPATAVIQLDKGRSISKVAVELGEDGDNSTGRTALVTVQYAQNGITTDLIDFGSKRMTVDSKEEFTADVPKSATHIYVTLSDPQNSDGSQGAFWPSVQEVEVFEEQEEKVSDTITLQIRRRSQQTETKINLKDQQTLLTETTKHCISSTMKRRLQRSTSL